MLIVHAESNFRKLFVVAIGFTCTAVLLIGLAIWYLRVDAIRDASRDTGNLAAVLAEQIANSIQSIDLILTGIQGQVETRQARASNDVDRVLRDEDTYKLLTERLSLLHQADFIGLLDNNGRIINTTRQWPSPGNDVSYRDYFQHFKSNNDKSIYIGKSDVDPLSGARVIFFSKRINGANNTFLGVVTIGVRLTYFKNIYKSIVSLRDQSFVFLHRDGTVIVRFPDLIIRAGVKVPAVSPWYRLVSQGGGTYRTPGMFDGEARVTAVRPLRNYPLVVSVGVTETAALATWRNQAIILGIGTLLVMFCSAFLLKALSKQFHRRMVSESSLAESKAILVKKADELERANAQLVNSHEQTDAALSNMSQGLVMFDSSNRMVVCNQRYLEMYGLSPEAVRPGRTLQEVVDCRIAAGHLFLDGAEQSLADFRVSDGQNTIYRKTMKLPDKRTIQIENHPVPGGGWVATHEDITEQKRSEERIAYVASHDGLTGLPVRSYFLERLEQALKRVRRGERLAVLYLDLDHMKQVNDTLGIRSATSCSRAWPIDCVAASEISTWLPV